MNHLSVAIADDNQKILDLLEKVIGTDQELDLVGKAKNGEEMCRIIKEKNPDVVLLDLIMPKMDGLQAAKAIRAMQAERPDAEEIPIIALSANAFAEDVQTSLDAGMNGHISKPLNVAEVAKAIARNLNKS